MSESKSETISSLVDNYRVSEQDSENAIDDMLKDGHLSETWQNYHLIGDVMRDEIPQTLQLDLSAQIAEAIADEPSILAPQTGKNESQSNIIDFKAKVVQLIKPLGQVAIAASAAGLMILGVQQNTAQNNDVITPSQVVQTKPLAGFANPVSFNFQQNTRPNEKAALAQRVEQQRRFQALILDHQQQVKISAVKETQVDQTEKSVLEKKQ